MVKCLSLSSPFYLSTNFTKFVLRFYAVYAALRIDSTKKDVRKVYQENGNLKQFADHFKDDDVLLAQTPDKKIITKQLERLNQIKLPLP